MIGEVKPPRDDILSCEKPKLSEKEAIHALQVELNHYGVNQRYRVSRKLVVAVEEAHLFIDDKYPIALDFLASLAKRIRKYDGMLITITQSVKDVA